MPANALAATIDKAAVIAQASALLADGVPTEQIVERLQLPITGRTLRNWIIGDDDAPKARTRFFQGKLTQCAEEIEGAKDAFPLARAREAYRAWSHLASVRDAAHFGQKTEVTHQVGDTFAAMLEQIAQRRTMAVTMAVTAIEVECKHVDNQGLTP